MLDEMFPNLGNKSNGGDGKLASGGNPTKLLGNEKNQLKAAMALPAKASQDQVVAAAKAAGEISGQVPILKQLSEYQLEQQKSALEILDTRINHHQQSMLNEQAFQKKISKHGQNVSVHGLTTQATQAHYNGYEAQFQAAADTVKF